MPEDLKKSSARIAAEEQVRQGMEEAAKYQGEVTKGKPWDYFNNFSLRLPGSSSSFNEDSFLDDWAKTAGTFRLSADEVAKKNDQTYEEYSKLRRGQSQEEFSRTVYDAIIHEGLTVPQVIELQKRSHELWDNETLYRPLIPVFVRLLELGYNWADLAQ